MPAFVLSVVILCIGGEDKEDMGGCVSVVEEHT